MKSFCFDKRNRQGSWHRKFVICKLLTYFNLTVFTLDIVDVISTILSKIKLLTMILVFNRRGVVVCVSRKCVSVNKCV